MTVAISAVFGLAIGSFLNVVVYRVPRKESIVRPPSACPSCGTPIRSFDNVPVLSYVLLGGRCRACKARISVRYPAVEAGTCALFAAAAMRFPRPAEVAFVAFASAVLLSVSLIDLEHRRVPNVIVLPGTVLAVAAVVTMGAAWQRWDRVTVAVVSGGALFALLFVIAIVSGGMGFGDVKLAAFIGVVTGWFGWEVSTLAIFSGFAIGGVVAISLLVSRRSGRKDAIPFAPMLCAGALVALYLGPGPVRAWLGRMGT